MNQFIVVKFESSVMLTLRPSLLLYATNRLIPLPDVADKVFEDLLVIKGLTVERDSKTMLLATRPLSNSATPESQFADPSA